MNWHWANENEQNEKKNGERKISGGKSSNRQGAFGSKRTEEKKKTQNTNEEKLERVWEIKSPAQE